MTTLELFDGEVFDLRRKFYDDCIANLDETYELVYIDYRDGLTDEQVAALAAQDWEALDELVEEWLHEVRFEGANYHRAEVMDLVERQWVAAHGEDSEIPSLVRSEFELSDWYDELRYEIEERDRSNPIRDLARSTGRVLMRQVVGEARWNVYHSDDDFETRREFVIDLLKDLGVPATAYNMECVEMTLAECGDYVAAMLVYAVDVGDLYDSMNAEEVEIINPYLYLGNPYMGDGYCQEQLAGKVRIRRDELTTDKGAFGYGWDEVAGVVVSAYECELRSVGADSESAQGSESA